MPIAYIIINYIDKVSTQFINNTYMMYIIIHLYDGICRNIINYKTVNKYLYNILVTIVYNIIPT